MPNENPKQARIDARLPVSVLNTIRRACELQGRSVSDFVVDAAREKAEAAIASFDLIALSVEDQSRFVELLLSESQPNAAMQRAAEHHRKLIAEP